MNNKAKKPYKSVMFNVTDMITEDVLSLSNVDNNGFDIDFWSEDI